MSERTLKLRVYPNKEQQDFLFQGFMGRQFAYHMGIILHQKEEKDFEQLRLTKKQLAAELVCNPKTIRLPYRPKWRNSAFLSQRLTGMLVAIRRHQKRGVSLAEALEGAVLPHPMAWLLEVPRCVFSQGFMDYQKALTAAFKSIKNKAGEGKKSSVASALKEAFTRAPAAGAGASPAAGFPDFYSLFDQQTVRFQIDKPATNQKHLETWHAGQIRMGDLVLRYKDPTALPEKVPSLVTVTRNQVGQYYATFLTSEPRRYTDPVKQAKLETRQKHRAEEIALARLENRAVGRDPNVQAEYFADSQGVVFSIAENQAIKNHQARMEAKQVAAARHLARTRRYKKSTGTPASHNHRKARQVLAKVHLDRRNQHEDFLQKKTSTLATFYPRQARESLNTAQMIQDNGAKETIAKGESGEQAKRFGVSKGMSRAALARQRTLMAQKLESFHPEQGELITLPKYERSTQCCHHCHEERLTVPRGGQSLDVSVLQNRSPPRRMRGSKCMRQGFRSGAVIGCQTENPVTRRNCILFGFGVEARPQDRVPDRGNPRVQRRRSASVFRQRTTSKARPGRWIRGQAFPQAPELFIGSGSPFGELKRSRGACGSTKLSERTPTDALWNMTGSPLSMTVETLSDSKVSAQLFHPRQLLRYDMYQRLETCGKPLHSFRKVTHLSEGVPISPLAHLALQMLDQPNTNRLMALRTGMRHLSNPDLGGAAAPWSELGLVAAATHASLSDSDLNHMAWAEKIWEETLAVHSIDGDRYWTEVFATLENLKKKKDWKGFHGGPHLRVTDQWQKWAGEASSGASRQSIPCASVARQAALIEPRFLAGDLDTIAGWSFGNGKLTWLAAHGETPQAIADHLQILLRAGLTHQQVQEARSPGTAPNPRDAIDEDDFLAAYDTLTQRLGAWQDVTWEAPGMERRLPKLLARHRQHVGHDAHMETPGQPTRRHFRA